VVDLPVLVAIVPLGDRDRSPGGPLGAFGRTEAAAMVTFCAIPYARNADLGPSSAVWTGAASAASRELARSLASKQGLKRFRIVRGLKLGSRAFITHLHGSEVLLRAPARPGASAPTPALTPYVPERSEKGQTIFMATEISLEGRAGEGGLSQPTSPVNRFQATWKLPNPGGNAA